MSTQDQPSSDSAAAETSAAAVAATGSAEGEDVDVINVSEEADGESNNNGDSKAGFTGPRVVLVVGAKGSGIVNHCEVLAGVRSDGSEGPHDESPKNICTFDTDALGDIVAKAEAQATAEAAAEATEAAPSSAEGSHTAASQNDEVQDTSTAAETEAVQDGTVASGEGSDPAGPSESKLVHDLRRACELKGGVSLVQVTTAGAADLVSWIRSGASANLLVGCVHLDDTMKNCIDAEVRTLMQANDGDEVDEDVIEELDTAYMRYISATKPLIKACKEAEVLHVVDASVVRAANDVEVQRRREEEARLAEAAAAAAAAAEEEEDSEYEDSEDEMSRPTTAGTDIRPSSDKAELQPEPEPEPEPLGPLPGNVILLKALDTALYPRIYDVPVAGVDPRLAAKVLKSYEGGRQTLLSQDKVPSMHGQGSTNFAEGVGNKYKGNFDRNSLSGHGQYTWADGTVFEGSFDGNTASGIGTLRWPDGSSYEGEVRNGLRHGKGTYTSEFCSYTGDWVDGKRVGHGICYYSADKLSYYDGEWLDGKRHGKGRMQYASGNFYEGDWAADQKCGDGKMSWVAQDCEYTGAWEGGKPHGYGEMIWREEAPAVSPSHPGRATNKVAQQMRNRYRGQFHTGKRHGVGVFYFQNGSVYEGSFENNLKSGHGVFTFQDGGVYEGEFVDDRMAEPNRKARTTVDVNVSDLFEELEKAAVAEQQQVLPSTELPDASPKSRSRGNSRTASRGSASASGSKALDAAKRSLRNTLLRWNTPLQAFYEHYATLCAESGDGGDGNNFTMSLNEFWKFVKACDIPSPQFTIADINRIFLQMRLRLFESVGRETKRNIVAQCPQLADAVGSPLQSQQDVHSGHWPLLFREFVEGIVRIAVQKYSDEEGSRFAAGNPAAMVDFLLHNKVGETKPLDPSALDPDAVVTYAEVFEQRENALRSVYRRFADEATRARMVVSAVDETLSVSELLLLLREGGVLANGGRPTSIQNPIEAAAAAAAAAEAAAAAAAREKAEAEAALDKAGKGGKKGKGKKSSAKAKSPQKTPKKGGKGAAAAEAEAAAKAEEDARLAAEAAAAEAEAAAKAAIAPPGTVKMYDAVGLCMSTNFGYNPLELETARGDQEPAALSDVLDVELVFWEFCNCLAATAAACLANQPTDSNPVEPTGALEVEQNPNRGLEVDAAAGADTSGAGGEDMSPEATTARAAGALDDNSERTSASIELTAESLGVWLDQLLERLDHSIIR